IRAIRILIAIAAYYDYEIWQMDVKTAFLNGRLDEDIDMEQPEGYVNPKYPNRFGFTQNRDEPCVYCKASGSNVVFLILYVDDILIMGNNIPILKEVKDYHGKCFSMKDLGEAAYILGIKIYRDGSKRLIRLSQSAYIDKILKKFNMHNSKKGCLPMEVKHELSNKMCASTAEEMHKARCGVCSKLGQSISTESREAPLGFCDASWQCDKDDTKSQTGYVFVVNGGAVDWKSKKQTTNHCTMQLRRHSSQETDMSSAVYVQQFNAETVTGMFKTDGGAVVVGLVKVCDAYTQAFIWNTFENGFGNLAQEISISNMYQKSELDKHCSAKTFRFGEICVIPVNDKELSLLPDGPNCFPWRIVGSKAALY
ncbi:retrotransposon protein, putative, ty1-copia subclass, partial [Tanacetum coccineum]